MTTYSTESKNLIIKLIDVPFIYSADKAVAHDEGDKAFATAISSFRLNPKGQPPTLYVQTGFGEAGNMVYCYRTPTLFKNAHFEYSSNYDAFQAVLLNEHNAIIKIYFAASGKTFAGCSNETFAAFVDFESTSFESQAFRYLVPSSEEIIALLRLSFSPKEVLSLIAYNLYHGTKKPSLAKMNESQKTLIESILTKDIVVLKGRGAGAGKIPIGRLPGCFPHVAKEMASKIEGLGYNIIPDSYAFSGGQCFLSEDTKAAHMLWSFAKTLQIAPTKGKAINEFQFAQQKSIWEAQDRMVLDEVQVDLATARAAFVDRVKSLGSGSGEIRNILGSPLTEKEEFIKSGDFTVFKGKQFHKKNQQEETEEEEIQTEVPAQPRGRKRESKPAKK